MQNIMATRPATTPTPPPPTTETPRLAALVKEIEADIRAARFIAGDDEMPDEMFGFEERAEICSRLSTALANLRRVVA